MKKVPWDNASRRDTIIEALGIIMLTLLIFANIVCVAPFADIPHSGSTNVSNLNNYDKAKTEYNEVIEIHAQLRSLAN